MQELGYIYAMVNQSIEGLVKIGKTTREPEARAKELSQATGVATPFYVAFSVVVSDCTGAETFVHAFLEQGGFRTSPNREFFQVPLKQAIEALLVAEREFSAASSDRTVDELTPTGSGVAVVSGLDQSEHPGRGLFLKAMDVYFGRGDELEDKEEGLRYLYQAKALSFPAAFTSLAKHYQLEAEERKKAEDLRESSSTGTSSPVRALYRKAFDILKEGAEIGHGRCWITLAGLYAYGKLSQGGERDATNAIKCWKKYLLSSTFHQNDDCKWTRDCEGVDGIGASGSPRGVHMAVYCVQVSLGTLPLDPEVRSLSQPIKDEIVNTVTRSAAYGDESGDADYARESRELAEFVKQTL